MEALPACLLRDVVQEAQGVAVIGIDEGQFVSCFVWASCPLRTPLAVSRLHLYFVLWFKLGSKW